ncbi:MAG: hypothetical protein JRE23_17390 [Deltaproteobacteria bacterium]|nr:hypothetical protein [Deltaproteobacteria bacterium]
MANFNQDIMDQIEGVDDLLIVTLASVKGPIVAEIKKRIRAGFGVADDTNEVSTKETLAPLSEEYRKHRGKSKLSPNASANKSNLTFTGQMLRSIISRVSGDVLTIFFANASANQKAEWVSKDRPFFSLTKEEEQFILDHTDKILDEYLNTLKDTSKVVK